MKYVVCVPDGCADEPLAELGDRTPLQAAATPHLDALAARGTVGRAGVIPEGYPPGSDVGNMSIFGYDPASYHTGRAPIEAASLGLRIRDDQLAFRANLVTLGADGTMVDFAGGHPDSESAARAIEAIDEKLGGHAMGVAADEPGLEFHAGVQYRHVMVAPASWADAVCVPPHDLTGDRAVWPEGSSADGLRRVMEASAEVLAGTGLAATNVWLWGQGPQPTMPSFRDHHGVEAALVTAVDLVRGLGVLTEMNVLDVEGATGWYDTNYEAKRDAALGALEHGADLALIHVEATDEAGHAGDVGAKVEALENWDSRILADLVPALDAMGPWRMLLLPDHATPLATRTHTADPVPYLLVDSATPGLGGTYTEAGVQDRPLVEGHKLMSHLLQPQ